MTEIFLNFWRKSVHTCVTTYLPRTCSPRSVIMLHLPALGVSENQAGGVGGGFSFRHAVTGLYYGNRRALHACGAGDPDITTAVQKVFVLSRFEGKSYQEIAAKLDVSVKAVEGHISKALSILRRSLKKN